MFLNLYCGLMGVMRLVRELSISALSIQMKSQRLKCVNVSLQKVSSLRAILNVN